MSDVEVQMLTKADDYPIHQTPEPVAYAGLGRNFYDRYFFNGYHKEEDLFFALGMGIYPQLDIMDAGFSIIQSGKQRNLLSSKVMNHERLDTVVGDIQVEVVKPLEEFRIMVKSGKNDIHADLFFRARCPANEEPRFTYKIGSQTVIDYTRLTQSGRWSGWLEVDGRRILVDSENWAGTRDRSWGIRPIGLPDAQKNPHAPPISQYFWLWAPINWSDAVSFYHRNDDALGNTWNEAAVFCQDGLSEELQLARSASSELVFIPGTRHAKKARISFQGPSDVTEITMTPRFHWYMKGVGYGHPEFSHGTYHGGDAQTSEEYDLSAIDDSKNLHIQAVCSCQMEGELGAREGVGVLEQLILGPHAPSGLVGLGDMAK